MTDRRQNAVGACDETRQGGGNESFARLAGVLDMERAGLCEHRPGLDDKGQDISRFCAIAFHYRDGVDDPVGDGGVAVGTDHALTCPR